MDKSKFGIKTLGIARLHKCQKCGNRERFNDAERKNIAGCIMYNSAGMWAIVNCEHCGWGALIYPTAINGVQATQKECDRLHEEMMRAGG